MLNLTFQHLKLTVLSSTCEKHFLKMRFRFFFSFSFSWKGKTNRNKCSFKSREQKDAHLSLQPLTVSPCSLWSVEGLSPQQCSQPPNAAPLCPLPPPDSNKRPWELLSEACRGPASRLKGQQLHLLNWAFLQSRWGGNLASRGGVGSVLTCCSCRWSSGVASFRLLA